MFSQPSTTLHSMVVVYGVRLLYRDSHNLATNRFKLYEKAGAASFQCRSGLTICCLTIRSLKKPDKPRHSSYFIVFGIRHRPESFE